MKIKEPSPDLAKQMNDYLEEYINSLSWEDKQIVEALNNYTRNLFSVLTVQYALERIKSGDSKNSFIEEQYNEYKNTLELIRKNLDKEEIRYLLLFYYNHNRTADSFYKAIKEQLKF